jgi:hypothetical protein
MSSATWKPGAVDFATGGWGLGARAATLWEGGCAALAEPKKETANQRPPAAAPTPQRTPKPCPGARRENRPVPDTARFFPPFVVHEAARNEPPAYGALLLSVP